QHVVRDAPLFQLDDRQLRAQKSIRQADLVAAQAQLAKLENSPRPEEVPAMEARVRVAEANLQDREDQYNRSRQLYRKGALSEDDFTRQEYALRVARDQLARAQADHRLLVAGAWAYDKDIARAAVQQARAQLEAAETALERSCVRAPLEGDILQVNIRPG